MTHKRISSSGFTIIELLIATAVFSIVLVVVTTGAISFTRQYYKGITSNKTQTVTRSALTEITQAIQFGTNNGTVTAMPNAGGGATRGFCINNKPYYYALGYQMGGSNSSDSAKDILMTSDNGCSVVADITTSTTSLTNPRELLGKNMRIAAFTIAGPDANNAYTVTLRVAYGDYDLLCAPTGSSCVSAAGSPSPSDYANPGLRCRGNIGSQFCSVISLNAKVAERLQ